MVRRIRRPQTVAHRTPQRSIAAHGTGFGTLAPHTSALGVALAATAMMTTAHPTLLRLGRRLERAVHVVLPQRVPTVAKPQQPRIKPRQMFGHVPQVAPQDLTCLIVERRVHHLRHIDQRRPGFRHQDVERRQVAMHLAAPEK
jgi:hypothetical protein